MRYIGIDVGFGYTKATDGIKTLLFPSVISPPVKMGFRPFQGDRSNRHDFLINHLSVSLEGETYFVGNLAINQGRFTYATLDRLRTQTLEYKLLLLAALSLLVDFPGEPLSIVTGLPVDDFEDRDFLEKSFKGRFSFQVAGQEVSFTVTDLTVVPQGCGAFMDLLFDDAPGEINDIYAQGPVGIVDIGYKTTDFVLMQSAEFAWRLSGSIKHGMSVIYQAAISKFSDVYRGNFDLKSVEEAIRDGMIHRLGERIAVDSDLLATDYHGLSQEIAAWIRQRWREQKISRILCAGGGSVLLKPFLKKLFPEMVFMEEPHLANVRGFQKGARYYYG